MGYEAEVKFRDNLRAGGAGTAARPAAGKPQKLSTAVEPEGRGESWALRDGLKDPRARSSQYCKPRLGGVFFADAGARQRAEVARGSRQVVCPGSRGDGV